jgi:hypothetical protein
MKSFAGDGHGLSRSPASAPGRRSAKAAQTVDVAAIAAGLFAVLDPVAQTNGRVATEAITNSNWKKTARAESLRD